MSKVVPQKPVMIMVYGLPGSGKTYFSRQLSEKLQAAHLQADRIRHELFQKPRYDREENLVVAQIMDYMAGEFLQAGVSVIYDAHVIRAAQRRSLREMATRAGATVVLIWQQIDADSAAARVMKRDRRKADDRYAMQPDYSTFQKIMAALQNPSASEEYVVISGKHVFSAQYSTLIRYMNSRGLLGAQQTAAVVKPGLVNLIPPARNNRPDADGNRRINII